MHFDDTINYYGIIMWNNSSYVENVFIFSPVVASFFLVLTLHTCIVISWRDGLGKVIKMVNMLILAVLSVLVHVGDGSSGGCWL